jgi:hypothetical protein
MRVTNLLPNLPRYLVNQTLDTLIATLPLPRPDTPETRDARDAAAIAELVALEPADALELILAARVIVVDAHVLDCHDRADRLVWDDQLALRLRRLAASMQRGGDDSRRLLLQRRAARDKSVMAKTGKAPARPVTSPAGVQAARPRTAARGPVGSALIVNLASVRPRQIW